MLFNFEKKSNVRNELGNNPFSRGNSPQNSPKLGDQIAPNSHSEPLQLGLRSTNRAQQPQKNHRHHHTTGHGSRFQDCISCTPRVTSQKPSQEAEIGQSMQLPLCKALRSQQSHQNDRNGHTSRHA